MRVVAFAPPRIGGLDVLLPILYELKLKTNCKIVFVFRNEDLKKELYKHYFLNRVFEKVVDLSITLKPSFLNLKSRLLLLKLVLNSFFYKKNIILTSERTKSFIINLMSVVTRVRKGQVFIYPRGMFFRTEKTVNTCSLYDRKDILCCLGADEYYLSKKNGFRAVHIGYPRLYYSWVDLLKNQTNNEIPNNFVCILLSHTVEGVFGRDELREWINEVVEVTRYKMGLIPILIKPHPMQDLEHLELILHSLSDSNIKVFKGYTGEILSKSKLVICHHSSTMIDSVTMGVPTIQYLNLTEHWLKRHPEKSVYLKICSSWAQSKEELLQSFKIVLNKSFEVPDIMGTIGHKEGINNLIESVK